MTEPLLGHYPYIFFSKYCSMHADFEGGLSVILAWLERPCIHVLDRSRLELCGTGFLPNHYMKASLVCKKLRADESEVMLLPSGLYVLPVSSSCPSNQRTVL